MNPDDTLGGHQFTSSEYEKLTQSTETEYDINNFIEVKDSYYIKHPSIENVTFEFLVYRYRDVVIINGSERLNKVSARMRWNSLKDDEWERVYEK